MQERKSKVAGHEEIYLDLEYPLGLLIDVKGWLYKGVPPVRFAPIVAEFLTSHFWNNRPPPLGRHGRLRLAELLINTIAFLHRPSAAAVVCAEGVYRSYPIFWRAIKGQGNPEAAAEGYHFLKLPDISDEIVAVLADATRKNRPPPASDAEETKITKKFCRLFRAGKIEQDDFSDESEKAPSQDLNHNRPLPGTPEYESLTPRVKAMMADPRFQDMPEPETPEYEDMVAKLHADLLEQCVLAAASLHATRVLVEACNARGIDSMPILSGERIRDDLLRKLPAESGEWTHESWPDSFRWHLTAPEWRIAAAADDALNQLAIQVRAEDRQASQLTAAPAVEVATHGLLPAEHRASTRQITDVIKISTRGFQLKTKPGGEWEDFPKPAIEGGNGKAHVYDWRLVRNYLMTKIPGIEFPESLSRPLF